MRKTDFNVDEHDPECKCTLVFAKTAWTKEKRRPMPECPIHGKNESTEEEDASYYARWGRLS